MTNYLVNGFDICDPVAHCPTMYEFHGCFWHGCPCCFFRKNECRQTVLHCRLLQGEKIKYIDVTSLYPWVNKTHEYPVGHPEVIVNPEDQDINHYFGVNKIDVLLPLGMYLPFGMFTMVSVCVYTHKIFT